MNIDKETITLKLNTAFAFIQQHALVIGIAAFCILYGYIILQASGLVNKEPEQNQVAEQLKTVPRPKIDTEAAKTIRGLRSQNINIQTIIDEARENPFSEEPGRN